MKPPRKAKRPRSERGMRYPCGCYEPLDGKSYMTKRIVCNEHAPRAGAER